MTQTEALSDFASKLKKGQTRAVVANDRDEEGTFWLASLIGDMIINPETFETNDETFEAGFLIVMVKWYQYDKTELVTIGCYRKNNM